MNRKKVIALVAASVIATLVLSTAAVGFAATSTPTSPAVNSTGSLCGGAGLGMGAAVRDAGGRLIDIVAQLTGKTTSAIVSERQDGKTLAQIATENGIDSTAIVDDALKVRKQALDEQVAAGVITQAQADAILEQMRTQLTQRLNMQNTACTGLGAGNGTCLGRGAGRGMGYGACQR